MIKPVVNTLYDSSSIEYYAAHLASDLKKNTSTIYNSMYLFSYPYNVIEDSTNPMYEGQYMNAKRWVWRILAGYLTQVDMDNSMRIPVESSEYVSIGHFFRGIQLYLAGDLVLDFFNLHLLNREINQIQLNFQEDTKPNSEATKKAYLYATSTLQDIKQQTLECSIAKGFCLSAVLSAYFTSEATFFHHYVGSIAIAGLLEYIVYAYRDHQNSSKAENYLNSRKTSGAKL